MAGIYLKAIRQYCLQCCLDQPMEVRLCPSERCVLHPYRFAKRSKEATLSPLQSIHEKCIDCCGGVHEGRYAVGKCDHEDCALWALRTGHRPKEGNLSTDEGK